eukprot:gnl/MRDRNA2_/MRDRNA2_27240_c0_seq1.p1 gnl/MRDRNA2_/MRDRNA2_27240_c0~~gnl/MRDRNA2_/MRDRNA2_27240_c0_seq1.p1  ORF type:complete len:580 (-),score=170.95 gnl/MRDRNA2_/MRDRNA2_27240_c0_seq1:96-1835(-)
MAVGPVLDTHDGVSETAQVHRFSEEDGRCVLTVDLPEIASMEEAALDIGEFALLLTVHGVPAKIPLPAVVAGRSGEAAARFSRRKQQLAVSWPAISTTSQDVAAMAEDERAGSNHASDTGANVLSAAPEQEIVVEEVSASEVQKKRLVSEPGPDFCGIKESSAEQDDEVIIEEVNEKEVSKHQLDSSPTYSADVPSATSASGAPVVAGSIWNAGSWHWEEKNCLDVARKQVCEQLATCASESLNYVKEINMASILLKDMKVSGEASISVRKGKPLCLYALTATFNWETRDEYGGPMAAKGSGTIAEFSRDDDDEVPAVEIKAKEATKDKETKAIGEWMRRKGAVTIGSCLRGACLGLKIMEAALAKEKPLMEDKARRAEEAEKAKKAKEATAVMQAQMLEQQKVQEQLKKVTNQGAAEGSTWNANAWHWEEKPATDWAKQRLTSRLENLSIQLLGGSAQAKLTDINVTGDASVSVRKGKVIVLFSLAISCKWIATLAGSDDGEDAYGAEALVKDATKGEGTLKIPEFTSEEAEKSSIQVVPKRKAAGPGSKLIAAFEKEGVKAIRAELAAFVPDLKARV